tara:strand:- start:769 stop:933 length:165 start_codon:yes stop_codon:yes gene_type:complete
MINEYYMQKIAMLEDANLELREKEVVLINYIYDLIQDDCPKDYKRVIQEQVFNN